MTGIASQLCGNEQQVASLGYKVLSDGTAVDENGNPFSKIGIRNVVLNDLSPIATFIAYNYNLPADFQIFEREAKRILQEVQAECGWMYETTHSDGRKGKINFTVWSEVFSCPSCNGEVVFLLQAFDPETQHVKDEFPCPHCKALSTKDQMELLYESSFDSAVNQLVRIPKRVPVIINYTVGKKKYEKKPDDADIALLNSIASLHFPSIIPTTAIPDMQMMRVGRMQPVAITHIHQFFLPRTSHILAAFWARAIKTTDVRLRNLLMFWLESQFVNLSIRNRYRPGVSFPYNPLTGVFYVPSMLSEASVFTAYENKLKRIQAAFVNYSPKLGQTLIETGSASGVGLPDSCVDYIFTDPPFGENIYYSDLNFFTETWFRVLTNVQPEAIIDRVKHKDLFEYQRLMQACFAEYYRVLKPGRWMTVEFHNSQNSVWNSIQEALQRVGFVIADVRTLDKKQGSFQQVTSASAVKQDLVISAYKPVRIAPLPPHLDLAKHHCFVASEFPSLERRLVTH